MTASPSLSNHSQPDAAHFLTKRAQELDRTCNTPLYQQVFQILKREIEAGAFDNLDFPSIKELTDVFGISKISIKHALQKLNSEGLISISPGRRTLVRSKSLPHAVVANFTGLVNYLQTIGDSTTVTILDVDVINADEEIAAAMECNPGDLLHHTARRRCIDGHPFSYLHTYMRLEVSELAGNKLFSKPISMDLLRQSGISAKSAKQKISACNADDIVAEQLGLPHATAVMKISRTYFSETGEPVIHSVAFYDPDRYAYETEYI